MITDKASYDKAKADYDKAKAELKDKQWRKDNLQGSDSFTWHMEQHIALISAALLTYRRANNIFEMDDYIIHDGELKVFAMWSTAIEGCAYIGYAYAEDGEMAKNDEFRHATDAEIKANRCLDQ